MRFSEKKYFRLFYTVIAMAALVAVSCQRGPLNSDTVALQPFNLKINTFKIDEYVATTSRVKLSWKKPDGVFSHYGIYRAEKLSETSGFDSTRLKLSGEVSGTDTVAYDLPGVSNVMYYYAIAAIRTDGSVRSRGVYSNIDSIVVGSEISFNIKSGDLYTVTRECNLYLNDPVLDIQTVRFTNTVARYLVKTNGTRRSADSLFNPATPPTPAQLQELTTGGWLSASGQIPSTNTIAMVKLFDVVDTANSVTQYTPSNKVSSFPWKLATGNGTKYVYAEVTYKISGRIDTLEDFIDIQPYQIIPRMQNKMGTIDETMRMTKDPLVLGTYSNSGEVFYTIYKPLVQFGVSIFGDTSIAKEFSYWLLTSESTNEVTFSLNTSSSTYDQWIETKPRTDTLTGSGAQHDDYHTYTYMLDTLNNEGVDNLQYFKRTQKFPQAFGQNQGDIGFRLRGVEAFNEFAAPGSYWGTKPLYFFNPGNDPVYLDTFQSTVLINSPATVTNRNRAGNTYRQLIKMAPEKVLHKGRKEFDIVLLFKGKYFNDTRTIISSKKPDFSYGMRTWFDFYPPEANFAKDGNPWFLTEKSVINSVFNFAITNNSANASIVDVGQANVTKIELVIARKPDTLSWTPTTFRTLTPQVLNSYSHTVFPYAIKSLSNNLKDVKWENIDPSLWPSGQYIMGLVVSDQFGNSGFALSDIKTSLSNVFPPYPNPWLVTVETGR